MSKVNSDLIDKAIGLGRKVIGLIKSDRLYFPDYEVKVIADTLFINVGLGRYFAVAPSNIYIAVEPGKTPPTGLPSMDIIAEMVEEMDRWVAICDLMDKLEIVQIMSSNALLRLIRDAANELASR